MSLLMDALKKAEKARQAQAKGDEPVPAGTEEPAETQALSLDPLDASGRQPLAGPDSQAHPAAPPEPSPDETGTGELEWSLADSQEIEELERDTPPPPPAPVGEGRDSTPAGPDDPAFSLTDERSVPEDTSATLPSIKAAQASVDSYFDGTHSVSMSMEQVRAAMDDEDTAERHRTAAPERPTQTAARTVFDAKTTPVRRRRGGARQAVGWVMLLLIVAGVGGGGGWFYWQTINERPRLVPSRDARARLDAPRTEPQARAPVTASVVAPVAAAGVAAAGASDAAASGAVAIAPAERAEIAAAPVPSRGDLTPVEAPPPEPEIELPAPPPMPDPDTVAAAMLGSPDDVLANLAAAIDSAGLQPTGLGGGGIKISRRSKPNRTDVALARAYEAWERGDLAAARDAYEQILAREPRSRDAMLGLAAVAVRGDNVTEASEMYSRVLTLNPRDSMAQAGFLAIQGDIDPVRGESHLKNLLRREPDASHLHFSLGNLYAAQSRWPEAQAAFFQAWRVDAENADYVYNLAVSLDHLSQRRQALEFYRKALDLADRRQAGFEPQTVLARIQAMNQAKTPAKTITQ